MWEALLPLQSSSKGFLLFSDSSDLSRPLKTVRKKSKGTDWMVKFQIYSGTLDSESSMNMYCKTSKYRFSSIPHSGCLTARDTNPAHGRKNESTAACQLRSPAWTLKQVRTCGVKTEPHLDNNYIHDIYSIVKQLDIWSMTLSVMTTLLIICYGSVVVLWWRVTKKGHARV